MATARSELLLTNPEEEGYLGVLEVFEDIIWNNREKVAGFRLPIKAYRAKIHGQSADEVSGLVNPFKLKEDIQQFRRLVFEQKPEWPAWATAIGGTFVDAGAGIGLYFVPMIDLEIDATLDVAKDLGKIGSRLQNIGLAGSFIRSGDVGVGGYHFIGHELRYRRTEFGQTYGEIMEVLVDEDCVTSDGLQNVKLARELGAKLKSCQSDGEMAKVGQEILNAFASIPNGARRDGLWFDPRWIAHRLIDEMFCLRMSPDKGYWDKPMQVAQSRLS